MRSPSFPCLSDAVRCLQSDDMPNFGAAGKIMSNHSVSKLNPLDFNEAFLVEWHGPKIAIKVFLT